MVDWRGKEWFQETCWEEEPVRSIKVTEKEIFGESRIGEFVIEGIPIVVFRPFYESEITIRDAKANFAELWEYIKKHPNDSVESISFYIFSGHPIDEALDAAIDSVDRLTELRLQDKLYVLSCPCSDGTIKRGCCPSPDLNKEKYSSLHISRISCNEAVYVEDKILKVLAGFGRNPYFTNLYRHPFYISS